MAKKAWRIQLEDGEHYVELDHGTFSGKRTIEVDGKVVEQEGLNLIDFGGEHTFTIGNHECVVQISTEGFTYSYDLSVDGQLVSPIN